jgi:hypothetical protein
MDNQHNNESGKVENTPPQAKPRRSKVGNGLLILAGILFLQSVFFPLFNWEPYRDTTALLSMIMIMAAILIGMVALFIRKKRDAVHKAIWFILIIAILILVFMMSLPTLAKSRELARNTICMANLRGLYISATLYSQENEGRLPEAGKWGKTLVNKDIGYKMFFCSIDEQAEADGISLSSYAMNVEASGKKLSELPEDMVLFFCAEIEESKARQWRQEKQGEIFESQDEHSGKSKKMLALYGGPELISFRHDGLVVYVEVNGGSRKSANPAELRWYIDPTKEIPQDVRNKINETYEKHLTRMKKQQLKTKCWIAGWLAGPYVLWLVVFIALKRRKHSTNC